MVGGGQSSRAVLHLPPSEAHQCDFARYVYLKHSTSKPVDIPFFLEKLGWTHSTKETNVLERVAKLQSGGSLTRSSRSAVVPKPSLAPSPSTSGPSSRLAQNPQTGESSAKRRRLNTTPSLAFVETPNTVIHVDSDEEDEWVEAPQAHNAVPPVSEKPTTSYLSKSEQEEYRKLVSDGGYTNWPEWVRRVTAHGILSSLRPKCWNDIAFRIQRKRNIRTLTPDGVKKRWYEVELPKLFADHREPLSRSPEDLWNRDTVHLLWYMSSTVSDTDIEWSDVSHHLPPFTPAWGASKTQFLSEIWTHHLQRTVDRWVKTGRLNKLTSPRASIKPVHHDGPNKTRPDGSPKTSRRLSNIALGHHPHAVTKPSFQRTVDPQPEPFSGSPEHSIVPTDVAAPIQLRTSAPKTIMLRRTGVSRLDPSKAANKKEPIPASANQFDLLDGPPPPPVGRSISIKSVASGSKAPSEPTSLSSGSISIFGSSTRKA